MTIATNDLVIYPTDTVWGIGCSLYSEKGFNRIADIKQTSKNKPLSIMFVDAAVIYKSFHFPCEISLSWLLEFFTLETTLIIPKKNAKIVIPSWATGDSEWVSVRSIKSDVIKEIDHDLKTPFFTTSLNITGHPPIVKKSDALTFQKIYAPDAHFLESKENEVLSGSSSTMVFLKDNLEFDVLREGLRIDEVKKHLLKLSLNR